MVDQHLPDDEEPDLSPETETESELPRIIKLSRRNFLGRSVVAATAAAGTLAGSSNAEAKSTRTKQETTLTRFRLFIEPRAFKYPVAELYPVLSGDDPRLVATSTDDWLAIWALDKPDQPRFKGKKRGSDVVRIVNQQRPFRRLGGKVTAVSEDGNVAAWYEHKPTRVRVIWRDQRQVDVPIPEDRGLVKVLGLGPDGAGVAVAMELGGILLFDLRNDEVSFIGELYDGGIGINHAVEVDEDTSRWSFAPCVCNIVSAQGDTKEGATISQYDRLTGTVITTTLPCGSPIPAGAVCVCNCVAAPIYDVVRTICTCDLVCTCDTVATGITYTYTYWYPN